VWRVGFPPVPECFLETPVGAGENVGELAVLAVVVGGVRGVVFEAIAIRVDTP